MLNFLIPRDPKHPEKVPEVSVVGRFDGYRDVAHPNLPIYDYDCVVGYGGGLFLGGERSGPPAQGQLWIAGGRKNKFEPVKQSVLNLIKKETGLTLIDPIVWLHHCNETFPEPELFKNEKGYMHEKGAETPSVIYYAIGEGVLDLDYQHKNSRIVILPDMKISSQVDGVTYEGYTEQFRNSLPSSVRRSLDLAFPLVGKDLEDLVLTFGLLTIDDELSIAQKYIENPALLDGLPDYVKHDLLTPLTVQEPRRYLTTKDLQIKGG